MRGRQHVVHDNQRTDLGLRLCRCQHGSLQCRRLQKSRSRAVPRNVPSLPPAVGTAASASATAR